MAWAERMRDSAYAADIPPGWGGIVAGYLGGGNQLNAWSAADWQRFPGLKKLPVYVRTQPVNPVDDAFGVLRSLHYLDVPAGKGVWTALDLETAVAPAYVTGYGEVLHWAGFKVLVYGSASTVLGNPPLDGYWVADYAGQGPFMYPGANVAATQYASPATGSGGAWDSSAVTVDAQQGAWWA
jgi:hypothetical protein